MTDKIILDFVKEMKEDRKELRKEIFALQGVCHANALVTTELTTKINTHIDTSAKTSTKEAITYTVMGLMLVVIGFLAKI